MLREDWLNYTVPTAYTKVVGAVLGAFGVSGAALVSWALWKIPARDTLPRIGAVALVCAIAIVWNSSVSYAAQRLWAPRRVR